MLRSRNCSVAGGVDSLSALLRGPQGRWHCCAWTTLPAAGLQGSPKSFVRSQKQIKKKWLFIIQFSCSVMSASSQSYGLQHTRPPCPSPTPGVYSNSCPLSRWYHPTISSSVVPSPPAFNLSQHQGLFRVTTPHQVAEVLKYWSFSFSISPSNEYSGLISFRMDWLDRLYVQGTVRSLLQHHSSKASILQHSAFFMVELSHPYMTPGRTIALLHGSLLAKWCLCFLICCLYWS